MGMIDNGSLSTAIKFALVDSRGDGTPLGLFIAYVDAAEFGFRRWLKESGL